MCVFYIFAEKAEKLQKEREEGKPEKKRRRQVRRKAIGPASSAGEAIEKILQEKKISSKINYDVLKSLNATTTPAAAVKTKTEEDIVSTNKRYFIWCCVGLYNWC